MQQHALFMNRCIDLATRGIGSVSPNPMVGAVLVHDGRIIGEGWHQVFGGPHAEVNCLASVKEEDKHLIDKSTLYVSLEPCNHHGKTPPCTDLIIQNKIPEVVIGTVDPHPLVNAKGINRLRNHGVKVEVMTDHREAKRILGPFVANSIHKRPYVILKWAQTQDGYMGKKDERVHITGPEANLLVHQWRSQVDAIAVGTNTAIVDDPLLTTRSVSGSNPTRITIDLNDRIPDQARIKNADAPTLVFTRDRQEVVGQTEYLTVQVDTDVADLLKTLYKKRIYSVLIEGGKQFLSSFIDAHLWDEARILTSPDRLENGLRAPTLVGHLQTSTHIGRDKLEIILPR